MATTVIDDDETEYSLGSPRRYYLSKRRAADEAGETSLVGVWRAKQEAEPGTALAADFPARATLVAAGYSTVEDLDGASTDELVDAGLALYEATAALAALE